MDEAPPSGSAMLLDCSMAPLDSRLTAARHAVFTLCMVPSLVRSVRWLRSHQAYMP